MAAESPKTGPGQKSRKELLEAILKDRKREYDLARREYERTLGLASKGAASTADVDAAEKEMLEAEIEMNETVLELTADDKPA